MKSEKYTHMPDFDQIQTFLMYNYCEKFESFIFIIQVNVVRQKYVTEYMRFLSVFD